MKYNKHYIGLEVDGSAMNFVTFIPRRAHVIMTIKLPQTKDTDDQLEDAGIETLPMRLNGGSTVFASSPAWTRSSEMCSLA